MQVRVARHTDRLAEVVAFYRDGLGLREAGGFEDHDGYDGVFLAIPGTGAHLELTSAAGTAPRNRTRRRSSCSTSATTRRCAPPRRGSARTRWRRRTRTGRRTALTFEDPDGFRVVLVPEAWNG